MDWEHQYLDKLEKELCEMRKQLNDMEKKMTENFDRAMARLVTSNKEKLQEYMGLNQRLDRMGDKVDRSIQWTLRFTVGTFLAVSGFVVAIVARLF